MVFVAEALDVTRSRKTFEVRQNNLAGTAVVEYPAKFVIRIDEGQIEGFSELQGEGRARNGVGNEEGSFAVRMLTACGFQNQQ